ncbi:unnamed protein product [Allacma fusca]|uniref:Uncharacterized protein n=1 Tax=Allacma fusca TaxID=39272 RepID=A0A8J2LK19_9HEXA|nr:unnamed protein product [Allacma fusca]
MTSQMSGLGWKNYLKYEIAPRNCSIGLPFDQRDKSMYLVGSESSFIHLALLFRHYSFLRLMIVTKSVPP